MIYISNMSREPISYFLNWVQKAEKQYNISVREYKSLGRTYWGVTPLSQTVCKKADDILEQLCNLIGKDWSIVFDTIPQHFHHKARELIISLVLCYGASWFFRVVRMVSDFPLLLLCFLEQGATRGRRG